MQLCACWSAEVYDWQAEFCHWPWLITSTSLRLSLTGCCWACGVLWCDRDNIRLLSTWSTAAHQSLTSPFCQSSSADGTTTSAQYIRPSLSLVRRSGTRCQSTLETRRSVLITLQSHRRRGWYKRIERMKGVTGLHAFTDLNLYCIKGALAFCLF